MIKSKISKRASAQRVIRVGQAGASVTHMNRAQKVAHKQPLRDRISRVPVQQTRVQKLQQNAIRMPANDVHTIGRRAYPSTISLSRGVVRDPNLLYPLLPDNETYELEISVIFGTYQRFTLLQRCVASIRKACTSISYEIVICDGGSQDGTTEWLRAQPDVVYIAGGLTGAVPAFNAAFARARGRFVLALNDDAEIEAKALTRALKYFADHRVGQVALAFFEGTKPKIEYVHGRPYANFALTRTHVARAIASICGGYWATCYRTYGGDTELSCWVYRLGYRVVAAHDANVRHGEVKDQLRQRNARETQRRQFWIRWPSTETMNFRGPAPRVSALEFAQLQRLEEGEPPSSRWSRIAATDPKLGELPTRRALGPERVLHWHLWTDEDPQASMAQAFEVLGSAGHQRIEWTRLPSQERGRAFVEAAQTLRPTLAFLQLQAADALPLDAIRAIRTAKTRDPSLVVCVWSGDVGPGKGPWAGSGDEWQYAFAREVDLMLFTGTGQVEHHRARGMQNAAYLQIGYDTARYHSGSEEQYGQKHTLVFMGQNYGRQFDGIPGSDAAVRREAVKALRAIRGFQAYGSGFGPQLHQATAGDIYRQSLMAVSVSATSSLARYSSDRLIRSMACGCATLVKRFDDMEGLGLRDKENCLVWQDVRELVALAQHWLAPERRSVLRTIGRAGASLMASSHTWNVRLHELSAIVAAARGLR